MGSDDRSVRLWDLNTGHCQHVLLTHTCADISFDMEKVVTASFDNTIGMWEWSTGRRLQCYQGHTGAVFCVDYCDELDIIVSGSADTTIKVWTMSTGGCQVTHYGHTDWVTKVILRKSKVNSPTHKIGDIILLSMDKKSIKVWSLDNKVTDAVATLPTDDDNIHLQPRLQFDGHFIVCASDTGVYMWNFETLELHRCFVSSPSKWLVAHGQIFSLLVDSNTLYIMNTRSEQCVASRELPPFRRSARGANFTPVETMWLNSVPTNIKDKVLFATSMPDYSILLLKFKDVT
ncbi:hypothetical protein QZH41_013112 [Actinostola sp. cb2023]|nr:hypothetical protein QZH41_013112 [Actinostola sp. cb2023]